MRLVVIDAQLGVYRVFDGRTCIAEYHTLPGEPATAEQVEEILLATTEQQPSEPA